MNKPTLRAVETDGKPTDDNAIPKPPGFDLERYRSKRAKTIDGVATLRGMLPVYKLAAAKDFVRLHPDEDRYWTPELCFVNVPTEGIKEGTLHLIDEDIAERFLPAASIQRYRLALASKPYDKFFLCMVPSQNLDNNWNSTALMACQQAKQKWTQAHSRKAENVDAYKINYARDPDAFPDIGWPSVSLGTLIETTFAGRLVNDENHPALRRLIGARQEI
jgi:hypothetical protein